jgi:hypothetical protein
VTVSSRRSENPEAKNKKPRGASGQRPQIQLA